MIKDPKTRDILVLTSAVSVLENQHPPTRRARAMNAFVGGYLRALIQKWSES